jgi:hypothetical protein
MFLFFMLDLNERNEGLEQKNKETSIWPYVPKIVPAWLVIAMLITFLGGPLVAIETSIFFLGGLALSIAAQVIGKAIEKVSQSEDAILAISVLMIGIATAIQLFVLSP